MVVLLWEILYTDLIIFLNKSVDWKDNKKMQNVMAVKDQTFESLSVWFDSDCIGHAPFLASILSRERKFFSCDLESITEHISDQSRSAEL